MIVIKESCKYFLLKSNFSILEIIVPKCKLDVCNMVCFIFVELHNVSYNYLFF